MRVVSVGLAAVAGVQKPGARGELGRDVDHTFVGLQQPLGQRTAHAQAPLDCPHTVWPLAGVLPHRGVTAPVGGEPSRTEDVLALVDDLNRGRQLVGIDPDDDSLHECTHALPWTDGTARWASLLRAAQSPLEPRLATAHGVRKPK